MKKNELVIKDGVVVKIGLCTSREVASLLGSEVHQVSKEELCKCQEIEVEK